MYLLNTSTLETIQISQRKRSWHAHCGSVAWTVIFIGGGGGGGGLWFPMILLLLLFLLLFTLKRQPTIVRVDKNNRSTASAERHTVTYSTSSRRLG